MKGVVITPGQTGFVSAKERRKKIGYWGCIMLEGRPESMTLYAVDREKCTKVKQTIHRGSKR